jgi:LssY-like putative type I secretion system component LssY
MRTLMFQLVSILGIVLVLLTVLVAVIRFYPYTYDFSAYPKLTHTKSGATGDPINMLFIGNKAQITQSFHQAGWLIPDPITAQTSARIAADSLAHRSYPTAPVSNLYVFGRVQDLAFEKPTTDVQYRGHIRIWQTGLLLSGQPVWVGAATYDSGIELSGTNHFPTHHIAPTVDLERNAVGADLEKTGLIREEADAALTMPIFYARNGGGDFYESDGNLLVISYTQASIPLHQPAWGIEELKTSIFLFYDALFTVVGALIAFLSLVVILIAGLAVFQFAERNRSLKKT